jgi:hypothetical protein
MRTLPIELVTGDRITQRLAAVKLLYLIYFPNDQPGFVEGIVTTAGDAYGRFEKDPEELFRRGLEKMGVTPEQWKRAHASDVRATEAMHEVAEISLRHLNQKIFVPAGGIPGLSRARGTEYVESQMTKLGPRLLFAGVALLTLYKMSVGGPLRGGASMKKLWWLLERWRPDPRFPKAESAMREWFKQFRDIAHISAAMVYFNERYGDADNHALDRTDELMRTSKFFENFGLSFRQDHAPDAPPPLDPETIWRVPLNGVPELKHPVDTLPVRIQLQIAQYKAPQPT